MLRSIFIPTSIAVALVGCELEPDPSEQAEVRRPLWEQDGGKSDIFGADERHDLFELEPHPLVDQLRSANGMLISPADLGLPADWRERAEVDLVAKAPTLGVHKELCEGERFIDQPVLLGCTAFLVGPDLAVSAGHCIAPDTSYVMVFGYALAEATEDPMEPFRAFSTDNIYTVVDLEYQTPTCERDIAFLRLDRAVAGATPLPYDDTSIEASDPLLVAGFPTGLPLKISVAGTVISTTERHFVHDVDILQGNSGSPVVGLDGRVKGVHVCSSLGHSDYEPGPDETCNTAYSHTPEGSVFEANQALGLGPYVPYLECLRTADFDACAASLPSE